MKKYQLTLLSLCVAAFAQAKVTLPSFFTDNMVIQQNSQLTLPGKAKAGKQVTVKVSWNHEKYTAKASADGHFSMKSRLRLPEDLIRSLFRMVRN